MKAKTRVLWALVAVAIVGISLLRSTRDRPTRSDHVSRHPAKEPGEGEYPLRDDVASGRPAQRQSDTRRIEVMVVDEAGIPQAGASVEYIVNGSRASMPAAYRTTSTTDHTGKTAATIPQGGRRETTIAAVSSDGRFASTPAIASDTNRLVLAKRVWSVKGRVAGAAPDELARTIVRAYSQHWPEGPRNIRLVEVQRSGEFEVVNAAGYLSLVAHTEGRVPSRIWATTVKSDIRDVELELGPVACSVHVEFIDSEGVPLAAGTLIRYQSGKRGGLPAFLDDAGEVTLKNVDPNDQLTLWPEPIQESTGRWRTARVSVVVSPKRFSDTVRCTVLRASWIAFRVIDAAGVPIRDAEVSLKTHDEEHGGRTMHGTTDAKGRWIPFVRTPARWGQSRLILDVAGSVLFEGDLTAPYDEEVVVRDRERWTSVTCRLEDWHGKPCRSQIISIAVVPPAYDGIDNINSQARGGEIPFFAFVQPELTLSIPESYLTSARFSVLETGHRERLIPLPASRVLDVAPSPDSGGVRINNQSSGTRLLDLRRERSPAASSLTIKAALGITEIYGLAPGKYEWSSARNGEAPRTITVTPQALGRIDLE